MTNFNKASPNNFQLIFPTIPTGVDTHDLDGLTMNIHGTVIPSVTLATTDINWQGAVTHREIGDITFDNWYVNFMVDSEFTNWTTLYKWLTFINNNKDIHARSVEEYKVDATLQILDNFRNQILAVDLIGVWINMLGEISLTYREGSSYLEATANFVYDRYELKNI